MSTQVLCTVGTSLLTNAERPWAPWRRLGPLPEAAAVADWLRTADPAQASAETNTLRALDLVADDSIAFLHTDTAEGEFCAARLAEHYQRTHRTVTLARLGQLGYGAAKFTSGLKALVDVTLRLVEGAQARGQQPVLCATGGFKAEIAFLNVIGALLGLEVVYMHEAHRELVRLPRLPLTWDAEVVLQNEAFFDWIDAEPRASALVEARLHGRPELRSLVEDGDDGNTYLTAAGSLLHRVARERLARAPRATWPSADPRPPQQKDQVSTIDHHRPHGWEAYVRRLCAIDCVTAVRYDNAARGGARVKLLDGTPGAIGVRYGVTDPALPLCVDTTATTPAAAELVAAYLRNLKAS